MEEPLDFTKICRVCLSNKNMVVSVFKRNISKKLMACAAVQVWPKDGLPAQICKLCAAKLHTSYLFKQQCERSDAKLRHVENINKGYEQNEQEVLEECEQENQEIINDNTSGFVFVDCDPLGEVNSGETVISEYSFSITEPPPLVPIVNAVRLTTPIKLEDHIESYCTEESILEANKNQAITCLVDEIPVTPVVKKMRKEVCSSSFIDALNLPSCGNEGLKLTSIANDTHIVYSSEQAIKHQQQGNLISSSTKEEALNAMKTRFEKTHTGLSDSHICNICTKSFSNSRRYNVHLSSHTNKKRFVCCVCDEIHQTEEELQKHMNIHTGFAAQENLHESERNNVCHICNKLFTDSSCLNDHIKEHNQEKFIGETCDESLVNSKELQDNSVAHSDKKPFACTMCYRTFSAIKYLTIHVKKHCPLATNSNLDDSNLNIARNKKKKEDPSLKNDQNKKSFKSATINPNKIFLCDLCDKKLLTEEDLIDHRKQHNKGSDLRCPVCDKPFITNADLKDHCAIHAQDKPFGCSKCEKRFSTHNNLNKHEKTHAK